MPFEHSNDQFLENPDPAPVCSFIRNVALSLPPAVLGPVTPQVLGREKLSAERRIPTLSPCARSSFLSLSSNRVEMQYMLIVKQILLAETGALRLREDGSEKPGYFGSGVTEH